MSPRRMPATRGKCAFLAPVERSLARPIARGVMQTLIRETSVGDANGAVECGGIDAWAEDIDGARIV
jgi:hypothetical protein